MRAQTSLAVLLFAGGCESERVDAAVVANGIKAKMKLPVQVDEETRLDDVRATGRMELGYFLTLTHVAKADLETHPIAPQLEATLRAGACKDQNYVTLFKAGLSLRVTYQTDDHADAARIVMTPKDCGFE